MIDEEPAEPVSWLRLERYHLGELSEEEAREVEAALARDPATRACLGRIEAPVQLNPLPELPGAPSRLVRLRRVLRSPWPIAGLAAAAALSLLVVSRHDSGDAPTRSPRVRVKGGDVTVELVREREGIIDTHPTSFRDGDRFKVVLTCPPTLDGRLDVVIVQGREASFPLAAPGALPCGNQVALPGAFTFTGDEPASVCAAWGDAAPDREALARGGLDALPGTSACTTLAPER